MNEASERVKKVTAKMRERMGDEAFLAHRRRIVSRSRSNPEIAENGREFKRAQDQALTILVRKYRREYEAARGATLEEAPIPPRCQGRARTAAERKAVQRASNRAVNLARAAVGRAHDVERRKIIEQLRIEE